MVVALASVIVAAVIITAVFVILSALAAQGRSWSGGGGAANQGRPIWRVSACDEALACTCTSVSKR